MRYCDYCERLLKSRRSDARFCTGSACRTANHRREKKRKASKKAIAKWPQEVTTACRLVGRSEALTNAIKDYHGRHGDRAAAAAVVLMAKLAAFMDSKHAREMAQHDQRIARLERLAARLEVVKKLVVQPPP